MNISKKTKGFGLIELMISILIASIIVGGLYSLLTSSILSFGVNQAVSNAGKTSRQVANVFETLVIQAGFVNYLRNITSNSLPTGQIHAAGPNWLADQVVFSDNRDGSPHLYIRFYGSSTRDILDQSRWAKGNDGAPDGYIFNCAGESVSNQNLVELQFYVDNNGLICEQHQSGTDYDENVFVIDPTVRNLSLFFAKSFSEGGLNDGYHPAGDIANNAWAGISSIKYAFVTSQPTSQRVIRSGNAVLTLFEAGELRNGSDVVNFNVGNADVSNVNRVVKGTLAIVNKITLE
ncbi:MAG: PilW family protein [Succinivibrionaceae bacterium]